MEKIKLVILLFILGSLNTYGQNEYADTIYIMINKNYVVDSDVIDFFYDRFYPDEINNEAFTSNYFLFNYSSDKREGYKGLILNQNTPSNGIQIKKVDLSNVKIRKWKDFYFELNSYDFSPRYKVYFIIEEEDYFDKNVSHVRAYSASYIGSHNHVDTSVEIKKIKVPFDLYSKKIKGKVIETYTYSSPCKKSTISIDSISNNLCVKALLSNGKHFIAPQCKLSLLRDKRDVEVVITDLFIATNEIIGEQKVKGKSFVLPYKFLYPRGKVYVHQDYFICIDSNTIGKIKFDYKEKQIIARLFEYMEIDQLQKMEK